ncbi:MAG: DUF2059 domain-containing protein [Pseudomonadota bacterium]
MIRSAVLAVPLAFLAFSPVAQAQSGEAQVIVPSTDLAAEAPEVHALMRAVGLYDILQIMSVEGLDASVQMEADMFPGQGGAAWSAVVAGIYSADRLTQTFEDGIDVEAFTPEVLEELAAFYASDTGAAIVAGEVAARRAFLEDGVQDMAEAMVEDQRANNDPRLDLLAEFNEVNSLIERNVAGALNGNLAFLRGLSDGGAFDGGMPEQSMLEQIWSQEPEIRASTTEWLFAYQITAYANVTDDDIRAYIDMSRSDAGQILNAALFEAFDVMFEQVSYSLGAAAAIFIAGEET